MRFQLGSVDHDGLFFAVTSSQPHHHLSEDAFVAPSLPAVGEGLGWTIFLARVSLTQTIAIDEYHTTQDAPVIDTWLAVGFSEVRFKTCHLLVAQPEKI